MLTAHLRPAIWAEIVKFQVMTVIWAVCVAAYRTHTTTPIPVPVFDRRAFCAFHIALFKIYAAACGFVGNAAVIPHLTGFRVHAIGARFNLLDFNLLHFPSISLQQLGVVVNVSNYR